MSTKGDVRALYAELRKLGWRIEKGGKHLRFYAPGSTELTFTTSDTPGNPNAQYHDILNVLKTGEADTKSTFHRRAANGADAFQCVHCLATTTLPEDVANRYCPKCSHFCDDHELALAMGLA